MLPTFDFETYSEAGHIWEVDRWKAPPGATKKGLPAIGAPVYTEHPSAEVLTLSYDLLDGKGLRRWKPGDAPPIDLWLHVTAGKPLEAHNIMFEYLVWMNICVPKYGWPPLGNVSGLRCSMAQARVNSLPGALGKLGAALGLDIQKDKRGGALLDKFSVPRKPTKANPTTRISPADEPDEFEALCVYCDQDVRAEQAASSDPRNAPMTPAELEFWQVDQEINRRGLALDRKGVRDCIAVMEQAISQYGKECEAITGGIGPSQVQALIGWLSAKGVRTSSLDEEHLTALLARSGLAPDVRRVLEIRAEVGSASVKKVYAFERYCSHDDRLRNLIVHHGARTGRPTGSGPQVLNLPKAGPKLADCTACAMPRLPDDRPCPWCAQSAGVSSSPAWRPEYTDPVLQVMTTRDLDTVERFFGKALLAISGCVRGLLQAGPGKKLLSSDYSAIEAVVAAAIAGEEWRLQTFREKRDIYLVSASKITGTTYGAYLAHEAETGQKHRDRQNIGKVAELALGYGGWIGAWRAFDPDEANKSDDDIKNIILAWRNASPAIVEAWGGQPSWRRDEYYGCEGAFIQAIQNPGVDYYAVMCRFRYFHETDLLRIYLPSGRYLTYHQPRLTPSDRRAGTLAIRYRTENSNPKYGPVGWVEMETWGSRIFENIDQAIAHCIQRYSILLHRAHGYPTVLAVYDENVAEVEESFGSVEEYERLMAVMPPWAEGWPIRADGGWSGKRYRKG